MVCVRNVFLKYGLGAKRLSEIWFGCETSSGTMKTGAKRLSYLWGGGETSFLSMRWGRNVSLKMVRTDYGAKSLRTSYYTTSNGCLWRSSGILHHDLLFNKLVFKEYFYRLWALNWNDTIRSYHTHARVGSSASAASSKSRSLRHYHRMPSYTLVSAWLSPGEHYIVWKPIRVVDKLLGIS